MTGILVPLGFFVMVVCVVVGLPLARAYARRLERGDRIPQLPMADLIARLERIEHGVEAMSVEIERIGEGQRFTTTLLSERKAVALPALSSAAEGNASNVTPQSGAKHDTPEQRSSTTEPGVNPAEGTTLTPTMRRP